MHEHEHELAEQFDEFLYSDDYKKQKDSFGCSWDEFQKRFKIYVKGILFMDIYSFISSPDIADYCREINKSWTPLDMAVIIHRSERPMANKHAAWRELIADYPDMSIPETMHCKGFESLRNVLLEHIAYEEYVLALFLKTDTAVYRYRSLWNSKCQYSDTVFTSFEKAWSSAIEQWSRDEAPEVLVEKVLADDMGSIEICFDYDKRLLYLLGANCDDQTRADWFSGIDFSKNEDNPFESSGMFYVDIPLPFKLGDILTIRQNHRYGEDAVFILEPRTKDEEKHDLRLISEGISDGTDMISWGFYVSDEGILYGDHTGAFDSFEYYRGKLTGNDRLLHYVSLYLKGEIRLPELLVMQGRIMLEYQLNYSLSIKNHGCYISDSLLVENRLTQEEKEEIQENDRLMPWLSGKLSIHQVEFLVREFGGNNVSVQAGLADGGGWYLGKCAEIVHNENHYAKTKDDRFNPARMDMARMVLEVYGHTERGWVDSHANGGSDIVPMPDYIQL